MAYYSNLNARHSSRDHFTPPPSLLDHVLSALPAGLRALIYRPWERQSYIPANAPCLRGLLHRMRQECSFRRLLSLPHLFVAIWILVLLWGERWIFQSSIASCDWAKWERWPRSATPHHLIFLADPQLVDPHTYTGRPWPLSTFTELHTDNYLKRSYIQLQMTLHPDTIFFLGDLFDGGREWATRQGDTGDPEWAKGQRPAQEQKWQKYWKKHYGENFWLHEYNRFGRIFFKHWNDGGAEPGLGQRGRRIIASLPGNHDLGFGANIKIPVRNRFQAYFGDPNRVDVIGNHTFVSVDSVSLSASSTDIVQANSRGIYGPVDEFLRDVRLLKRKAVARELNYQNGALERAPHAHKVSDLEKVDFGSLPSLDPGEGSPGFPTILLTHVPLFREPGTPCGPLRERWPPAIPPKGQTTPVFPDDRNAIPITKGYQYQNVVNEADSVRIVENVGDVVSVFSGDDHDYCEIVHPSNKNSAREITVKSMSWAMGVRRPGFLMLSMWNPIDARGSPIGTHSSGHGATATSSITLESHLCLLPDQLGIFIRYLLLLSLTLLALLTRALLTPILGLEPFALPTPSSSSFFSSPTREIPLISAFTKTPTREREHDDLSQALSRTSNSSTSSTSSNGASLAPRSTAVRTRSVSPGPGTSYGYGLPPSQSRYVPPQYKAAWAEDNGNGNVRTQNDDESAGDWDREKGGRRRDGPRDLTPVQTVVRELWTSVWRVSWLVMGWYLYLVWHG